MSKNPEHRNYPGRWLLGTATLVVVALAALLVWANQASTEQPVERFTHLHGLSVAPWAPDTIFVSTHHGLLRIAPEGEWQRVGEVPHDFMGFQVNPSEEGVLYSSGHPHFQSDLPNPVGFMVSTDAGRTWEIRSLAGQVDFHVMTVQPTDGSVVYGWSGGLWSTRDAGETWEQLPNETAQPLGDVYGLAVHPTDADTVLAGTSSGLWRSTDGGISWQTLTQGPPVTAISYSSDGRLYAYIASPNSGLMVSRDDGQSWVSVGLFVEGNDAIGHIAPHPTLEGTLLAGSFGQNLYQTHDAGATWEQIASGGVPQAHDHQDEHER